MAYQETRAIVSDYINFRLEKNGFNWDRYPILHPRTKVTKLMRLLGEECEQYYIYRVLILCKTLDITYDTAYSTFMTIINEIFADDINWSRIIVLFSFGGAFAVQCIERGMPSFIVHDIVEWISTYVVDNLYSWIAVHGGWNGICNFYYLRHNSNCWLLDKLFHFALIIALGAVLIYKML